MDSMWNGSFKVLVKTLTYFMPFYITKVLSSQKRGFLICRETLYNAHSIKSTLHLSSQLQRWDFYLS